MKYKLINVDNPLTAGNTHVDRVSRFEFDGEVFYFGSLRSSRVQSITVRGEMMTVQTNNTKYTFKKDD